MSDFTIEIVDAAPVNFDVEVIASGPGATVEIGTVETGDAGADATVTNSGTANHAVLDFVIPKGDTGSGASDGDKGDVVVSSSGTVWTVNALVGDSGAGGTAGMAPAPAAGDAAAGKFLKADGTWAVAGQVTSVAGRTGAVTLTTADVSGLGSLATQSGTFSGTSSGTNTGDQDISGLVVKASNLSDLVSASTARTNLGLGSLATQSGTFSGTSSGTNTGDQDISGLVVKASNLSDLVSASTARTNLGLGSLATQSGTFSGTSSGTNTGDQTITLTGDVTGSGAGSFAATIANSAVTLAKMADLAQDQFIGRTTASTGVPQTATITSAARTVLDDTTVSAMVDTLGGASATGSGGIVRATSPTLTTPTIGVATCTTLNGITPTTTETFFIGAAAFIPRTTTGCGINSTESTSNKINLDLLEFDAATSEYAQVVRTMPKEWNLGTLTAKFYWTAASGSGTAIFGIQAISLADDDAIDTAFGSAQTATDTLLAALDMHISPATSAFTVGGTPAAGRPVVFQIYRDISDTLAVDAQFIGVEITYTKS